MDYIIQLDNRGNVHSVSAVPNQMTPNQFLKNFCAGVFIVSNIAAALDFMRQIVGIQDFPGLQQLQAAELPAQYVAFSIQETVHLVYRVVQNLL